MLSGKDKSLARFAVWRMLALVGMQAFIIEIASGTD